MRSVNLQDISHLSPKLTWAKRRAGTKAEHTKTPDPTKAEAIAPIAMPEVVAASYVGPLPDPMIAAINAFPSQLAAAMASMKAPVMAPRPAGTWIIDVRRDGAGQMSQMEAKFHETK